MKSPSRLWLLTVVLVGICLALMLPGRHTDAQTSAGEFRITGSVHDRQGVAVEGAHVSLVASGGGEALAEAVTQPDGHYSLPVPATLPDELTVQVVREHFDDLHIPLDAAAIQILRRGQAVIVPDAVLPRRLTPAFWIATLVFIGMLALIALGKLHNTLAALLGVSILFAVSYLGRPLAPDLFIFDFRGALRYVDWNVVFLIMGMMIVIAVVERTGVFQWLAFNAYRLSGGRVLAAGADPDDRDRCGLGLPGQRHHHAADDAHHRTNRAGDRHQPARTVDS